MSWPSAVSRAGCQAAGRSRLSLCLSQKTIIPIMQHPAGRRLVLEWADFRGRACRPCGARRRHFHGKRTAGARRLVPRLSALLHLLSVFMLSEPVQGTDLCGWHQWPPHPWCLPCPVLGGLAGVRKGPGSGWSSSLYHPCHLHCQVLLASCHHQATALPSSSLTQQNALSGSVAKPEFPCSPAPATPLLIMSSVTRLGHRVLPARTTHAPSPQTGGITRPRR